MVAENAARLSGSSLVPLGSAIAVGLAMVGGLLTANHRLSEIEFSCRELANSSSRIEKALADYCTRAAMVLWIEQIRARNPSLQLPSFPQ